jgi:glyoxylase-like metal-dependent hydrolase (beta-lactamase superfamily II)
MISIEVIPTGMLEVNCSLISNQETRELFVVDPGGDEDIIYQHISDRQLELKAILHTHAHFDHIMGTGPLLKKYYAANHNVQVYLNDEDKFLWDNMDSQSQKFGLSFPMQEINITHSMNHNEILNLCGIKVRVMKTPGHSPGSCTFFIDEPDAAIPVLIAGDVIFQGSIGRTDLWKGDFDTLMKSINDSILSFPDQTRIIPGHGPDTTVGEERRYNPFLAQ